jgi:DNA polymerase
MNVFETLRLQLEWGADEAVADVPIDRRQQEMPQSSKKSVPKPQQVRATPGTIRAGPAEAAALAGSCSTLDALRNAMDGFTGCDLRSTATQLVFADGAADARIMVIGEAPGAEEDRAGRPFIGAAGQLLDRMLASVGLDRTQVRIANVVPWRPPGNRNPTETEISICLPFLHRQVALIRPACLLVLGAVAAKALLAEPERQNGIRRLRGTWRDVRIEGLEAAIPCLPSYHPAYLLRTSAAKREAWIDLLTLREWITKH